MLRKRLLMRMKKKRKKNRKMKMKENQEKERKRRKNSYKYEFWKMALKRVSKFISRYYKMKIVKKELDKMWNHLFEILVYEKNSLTIKAIAPEK